MSFVRKADYVLEQAKALAPNVKNWADFTALVFGQRDGIVAKTFPDETERQMFYDSEQYKKVSAMREKLMRKFGTAKGGTPEKSGRILVRLPKSLHKELEIEAKSEGVSVNQLVVSKLATPIENRAKLPAHAIAEAYKRVYDGFATDRIVVDPDINPLFLAECRRLGLTESDYAINHALMDIRKSKKVELPKAAKRTEFRDYDEYQFASEIAIRLLQRSDGVTLDQILCDPELARKFDRIAQKMAPKQPPLKLRCAALNLRKTRRLGPMKRPEAIAQVDWIRAGPVRLLSPNELPKDPGVYSIFDHKRPLFAGEAENLQLRFELHLEGKMPDWLGVTEDMGCELRYAPMPTSKQKTRQNWLHSFINEERPLLNYQKVA